MTERIGWESLGIIDDHAPEVFPELASANDAATSPQDPKQSQATEIMSMARARFNVIRGDDGKSYAVAHDQPGVAFGLRGSGGLRQQLAATFYDEKNRVASGGALQDALATIEGEALRAPETPVHLRCGRHRETIIIDRADPQGHVIEVSAQGWRSVERSPILFRRSAVSLQFPLPAQVGDLEPLRDLVNVDETGFRLLVAYIVAAWIPDIPHPILALMGEQGVAKSSAARIVLNFIDPSAASLVSQPRSADDWAVTAYNVYALGLDNVSRMQPWLQDALCKAVTGDVFVRRELYSDDGLWPMRFRRAIVLTTIDPGSLQGDVADRLLPIELQRIKSTNRRTDRELTAAIEKHRPAVLAALLDIFAGVLRELPNVTLEQLPRMADFAEVLAALDASMGWDTLRDYTTATESAARDVVDGDSFAGAVVDLIHRLGYWEGTCQQLLSRLVTESTPKGWPETARAIAARLKRLSPALRAAAIEVDRKEERSREGAVYRLQRLGAPACLDCRKPLSRSAQDSALTVHASCTPPLHDEEPF
jgi:hypothetical protein